MNDAVFPALEALTPDDCKIPPKDTVPTPKELAKMIVLPSNAGWTISESAKELFDRIAATHELFLRGGKIMKLAEDEQGRLILDIVSPESFCSLIEKYGRPYTFRASDDGKQELKSSNCSIETAAKLLACDENRRLPHVRGLHSCPVLADVAGVPCVLSKGYHSVNGGIIITGGDPPIELQINEAIQALKEIVSEFDFLSPSDRSRALASLLTPALMAGGWIKGHAPIDVAEANASQSGKTYRQKNVFALYNESPSTIAKKNGGVGGVDESLSQAMINGRPFIQLDNVRGKLDSQFFEMVITAGGSVPCRVPHRGEIQVYAPHFCFFMSSNGVESTRDLANRSSIIRIRKREGYSFRKYAEGDLLRHVIAQQSYYMGAVFSIIKEWVAKGRQATSEMRHDFREWVGGLDWIVQKILGEAPLMDGHEAAQLRVSRPELTFLRTVALAVEEEGRLGMEFSASNLGELCEDHDVDIPGLKTDDEDSRKKRIGVLCGKAFEDKQIIEIDRYRIERTEREQKNGSGNWKPTKMYRFFFIVPHTNQATQDI